MRDVGRPRPNGSGSPSSPPNHPLRTGPKENGRFAGRVAFDKACPLPSARRGPSGPLHPSKVGDARSVRLHTRVAAGTRQPYPMTLSGPCAPAQDRESRPSHFWEATLSKVCRKQPFLESPSSRPIHAPSRLPLIHGVCHRQEAARHWPLARSLPRRRQLLRPLVVAESWRTRQVLDRGHEQNERSGPRRRADIVEVC